ncbi:Pentatricopeptide repeat-containing protein, mitochondrial [Sesamum alatum]|uniref:Pentatricopeptide repeat-containing protein, mitochondrial n=1 Tax=Sesamum alatum TaxID=300844 RepID=A0AAE1XWA6_9LAMI|nr:Pentatricopeptide repeat-containing protein, mitochondrial [Sesamum alatum]
MVDLYARAGRLKEAYKVILDLPFEPTTIFSRTLLNRCRIRGNTEFGVCAAEQILKLEPYNSSALAGNGRTDALLGTRQRELSLRGTLLPTAEQKEDNSPITCKRVLNQIQNSQPAQTQQKSFGTQETSRRGLITSLEKSKS